MAELKSTLSSSALVLLIAAACLFSLIAYGAVTQPLPAPAYPAVGYCEP